MMMVVSMFAIANVTSSAGWTGVNPGSVTTNKCNKRTAYFEATGDGNGFNQNVEWRSIKCSGDVDSNGNMREYSGSHTWDTSDWAIGTYSVYSITGGKELLSLWGSWYAVDWNTGWQEVGYIYVTDGGHNWDEGMITTQPTCTTDGERTCVCLNNCGYYHTEPVTALGHDYSFVVKDPTCTEDGYTTYRCSRCGDTYTADETQALGHDWDEGVVVIAPTLDTMGTTRYTCTRCNATQDVVDIPVLTGINELIYYAEQIIDQYINGELFTDKAGFDSTWTDFTNAYFDALMIVENGGTDEETEQARATLSDEIEAVKPYQPLDVTELQNAIDLTPELEKRCYVPATYSAWEQLNAQAVEFVSMAATGEKALSDEAEMQTLASELTNAFNSLEIRVLDYTGLNAAIDAALAKIELMQSQGYEIVASKLAAVNGLIDEARALEEENDCSQEDIDALTESLTEATDALEFEFAITDDTEAILEEGNIYGFKQGITANEIVAMFSFVGTADVQVVETANGLGTGSKVIFTDSEGQILEEYTIVIFGDASGDGWIDSYDAAIASEIANFGDDGDELTLKALDLNNDGFIDSFDAAIINSIANMEVSISQDGNFTVS